MKTLKDMNRVELEAAIDMNNRSGKNSPTARRMLAAMDREDAAVSGVEIVEAAQAAHTDTCAPDPIETAIAKVFSDRAIAALELAVEADKLAGNYSQMLIDLAVDVDDRAAFDAAMTVAYQDFQARAIPVPGSVRNNRTLINWAIDNDELKDEAGINRTISQIKKAKSDAKNVAVSEDTESQDTEESNDTGHVELDQAIRNIAMLNTKAGEIKKAYKDGDTLASDKARFLRTATINALDSFNALLGSLVEDIVPDSDLITDDMTAAEIELAEMA
jgi:hypothetical protein